MFGRKAAPTVRVRRSRERGFEDFGWADNWMTFNFGGYRHPEWNNFGPLRVMVENHIQPYQGFNLHSHRDAEILTYVVSGTLTHRDSMGHESGITAGEMQHISAGQGIHHSEKNIHGVVEHNYQIWLVPDRYDTDADYQQLKYSPEERQGRFRLYVSPNQRDGSMPINTDARVYAGLFSEGDTARHAIEPGRGAWVQMVDGKARVNEIELEQGDGVGLTDIDELDMKFDAPSEVLLFDLKMNAKLIWR